jgi:hypothetical protein
VSVVVGFLYILISSFVCSLDIVKSRKYGIMGLVCRIKFYVIVYFVYVCGDGVWIGFCYILYNQNVILVSCVECCVLGV